MAWLLVWRNQVFMCSEVLRPPGGDPGGRMLPAANWGIFGRRSITT